MPAPALQVDGARRLRAALRRAGVSVQNLKDAHAAVAAQVAADARPRTPVRSGALRASLRSSGTQSAAIVRAGRARVPYAGPIHFGWPGRNIAAQPWITTTAERTQGTWEDTYLRALEQIIATVEGTHTP
jgi:hypothetical protein